MPLISSGYILYRLTAAAAAATDKDARTKKKKANKKCIKSAKAEQRTKTFAP